MSTIRTITAESTTVVDAPVAAVWRLIVEQFADIDQWSSGVNRSQGTAPGADGQAGERACEIAAAGFQDTSERVVETVPRTRFRYELYDGLPGFVVGAENTWTFAPEGSGTRLTGRTEMRIEGIMGLLGGRPMRRSSRKALDSMTREAKYMIEHGRPHPDKVKAAARYRRKHPETVAAG
ncbi:MAG: SRPBCC family protein [Actinomycetota bacterium]